MTPSATRPLRVIFAHWPPYQTAEIRNGVLAIGGPSGKALEAMASSMNFTYTLKQMHDFGVRLPNGTWKGMINTLLKGEADAAMSGMICSYHRFQAARCGPIVATLDLTILSASSPARFDAFSYLRAFDVEVWVITFVSLTILAFLVALGGWLPNHVQRQTDNNLFRATRDYWWDLFGLLFAENSPRCFARGTQKLLLGAWLITVLVMANSFGCLLRSQQAVFNFKPEVDSIEDLADKHHLTPFMGAGTAFERIPQKIPTAAVKSVWDRARSGNTMVPFKELFRDSTLSAVAAGKAAIVVDDLSTRLWMADFCERRNVRNFVLASRPIETQRFSNMMVSRHLDERFYNELFSKSLRLLEAGLIQKWYAEAQGKWERCVQTGDIGVNNLRLDDLMPFFLLWGIMCGMSFCALMCELGWARVYDGRRSRDLPIKHGSAAAQRGRRQLRRMTDLSDANWVTEAKMRKDYY